jgi:hypothetical protein
MDILFFCAKDSLRFAHLAVRYYARIGFPVNVIIYTPSENNKILNSLNLPNCLVANDESIPGYEEIVKFLNSKRGEILEKKRRTVGWYLQQYLKVAAAFHSSEPIFISDGDTIFSGNLLADISRSPKLLTTKENPDTYNNGCRVLGYSTFPVSFVANGGLFCPRELRLRIPCCTKWFQNSLETILDDNNRASDFSEYQIMGNILSSKLNSRRLRIFRRFDMLSKLEDLDSVSDVYLSKLERIFNRYDALAWEFGHKSYPIKRVVARLAFLCNYSW